jgi:hypothetical protein
MANKMINTYACKNAISSSKQKIAVTVTQGTIATTASGELDLRSDQEKPLKIFNKA